MESRSSFAYNLRVTASFQKKIVICAAIFCIAALGAALYAARDRIREEWCIHIVKSGNREKATAAARELAEIGTERSLTELSRWTVGQIPDLIFTSDSPLPETPNVPRRPLSWKTQAEEKAALDYVAVLGNGNAITKIRDRIGRERAQSVCLRVMQDQREELRLRDRKSTRLNSSHLKLSRMPSSA